MSVKTEIDLYNYQKGAIDKIFERFEDCPSDYHLLRLERKWIKKKIKIKV